MHPTGLSDKAVSEIRQRWAYRVTVTSLAREYNTSTEVIRKIIGATIHPAPRKE